jgi:hypothetical protein
MGVAPLFRVRKTVLKGNELRTKIKAQVLPLHLSQSMMRPGHILARCNR